MVRLSSINDEVAADLASSARWAVSTDNGNSWTDVSATVSGTGARLEGLTPGTAYRVRATVSDKQATAALTTEAALQAPNNGMETWYEKSGQSNWSVFYAGASESDAVWGTNNPMTTSQGDNKVNQRISGTLETSDAASGSKAALLQTAGWGSGNTTVLTLFGANASIIKYIDPGLLHLGSNRSSRNGNSEQAGIISTDDLDCGISFASRPSSLTFKYKYLNKNSEDKGYAEIWVKDASGNILASGNLLLEPASSYQDKTIQLNYKAGAAKGAKLYIKFLSTYDKKFLVKSLDNISFPSTGSKLIGSQLYIDDITLNY